MTHILLRLQTPHDIGLHSATYAAMRYAAGMARNIELPEPWEHVETVIKEERDALESSLGANINESELGENDMREGIPISHKAWLRHGVKWVRIRNTETSLEALIRLQTLDGSNYTASSISFPLSLNRLELSGADIRSLPVASIAATYSYDEQAGTANLNTFLHLMQEIHDDTNPLDPLPRANSSPKFAALVARQYRHIEDHEPGEYVAGRMAELNKKPLATVQRWVTKARKAGFLPPTATGRRPRG